MRVELGSVSWPALCGMALSLGLRHGFDADHLTVIDGLVRRNAQRQPRVARVAGVLFSLGHGSVVVIAACATLALSSRWQLPSWLEPAGIIISATILLMLAALNLRAAWTAPPNGMVAPVGIRSRLFGQLLSSDNPRVLLGLGALFAISADTLAQAAALGLAASHFGGLGRAATAAGCFTAGMVVATGINGLWIARLIRTADRRAALASRIMAGAIGLTSLVVALSLLSSLMWPPGASATAGSAVWSGLAVIVVAGLAFATAMLVSQRPGHKRRSDGQTNPNTVNRFRELPDVPKLKKRTTVQKVPVTTAHARGGL